jgi:ribosomal protein S27AE
VRALSIVVPPEIPGGVFTHSVYYGMAAKSIPLISAAKLFLVKQEKFYYKTKSCPRKILGEHVGKLFGIHNMDQREPSAHRDEGRENWWEYCPVCSAKLVNHKCRFVCSNPRCNFFMSCSEFEM